MNTEIEKLMLERLTVLKTEERALWNQFTEAERAFDEERRMAGVKELEGKWYKAYQELSWLEKQLPTQ